MFQNGFPNNLIDDVTKVVRLISNKVYNNVNISISEDEIQYFQNDYVIRFPSRIYYYDVINEDLDKLTLQQKMILHCIYSRSCNGFVRQKHLYSLLIMDYYDWAIPYIIKACDEYVIEILEMTYNILKEQDTEQIKRFCLENQKSMDKSYDRMISYWNEYYRDGCKDLKKYIGSKLFKECFGYSK